MTKRITSGQRDQIMELATARVRKTIDAAGLDKEGAQLVIASGDELGQVVGDAMQQALVRLSVGNQFADEKVRPSYTYPQGYKVKRIAKQMATLRQLFPELKDTTYDKTIAPRPLPGNAEGWFAIPRWEKLNSIYGEAVEKLLAIVASKRKFYNYCDGQTGPEYLRQHAKTVQAMKQLGDEQKGHDILIIPAQFGLRHRGRSVRQAREVMNPFEFGLGAFAVGIMLLIHPEREVQWEQLHVDCAGDEFAPAADGRVVSAPVFSWRDGGLRFDCDGVDDAGDHYGSASAFLPQ